MSNKPMRLIEKYEIIVEHLDFDYIRQCTDAREVEKIVKVLRSGEEGYFPQLTVFAEQRLKSLKPNSKLFRTETPLITRESMVGGRWEEINENMVAWENQMKTLHSDILHMKGVPAETIPPIRSVPTLVDSVPVSATNSGACSRRIKSCDYESWDRYDPDTEILKIDLDEDRHKEFVKMNNEKNSQKVFIEEIKPDVTETLNDSEKEVLATRCREKGNEYFRSKEFEMALNEYNGSIALLPTAACFNNRAMTYIKLLRFKEAVSDCDKCLMMEPCNIKALLRKAQALVSDDKRREAYQVYCKVLISDSSNKLALNGINDLRWQLPDLPPPNAFQVPIEEIGNEGDYIDTDFADLIKPKKLIKDKLPDAMKAIKNETAKLVKSSFVKNHDESSILSLSRPESRKALIEEL